MSKNKIMLENTLYKHFLNSKIKIVQDIIEMLVAFYQDIFQKRTQTSKVGRER